MQLNIPPAIISAIIFLFIIWLVHRFEKYFGKHSLFSNFPFLKDSLENFQRKIDYLTTRIEIIEEKINKIEQRLT